jgi:hypothetical protein
MIVQFDRVSCLQDSLTFGASVKQDPYSAIPLLHDTDNINTEVSVNAVYVFEMVLIKYL